MLDYLRELSTKPFDFVTFTSGNNGEDLAITGNAYAEPGEPVGGSAMGKAYHVILFKENDPKKPIHDVDTFDAILVDPLEYMSGLLPQEWYGIIARQTSTSNNFIQKTFDILQKY